ncbi:MAG: restriction endonuclease subunit S [Bacteroidota bacterium]|nr:restriction endonuclease subunit S [Bacteroidota bacterium]
MEHQISNGWISIELEKLFNLFYGKGLPVKSFTEEGYNVYGANGIIGKYSKYNFENEKVIISCRGAASGAIHKTKPKSFVTSNSIILDEKIVNLLNLDFVKYAMINVNKEDIITGTAQPQITIQLLKNLKFPLPPRAEQDRIVAQLDSLFGKLEQINKSLDHIPTLLKNFRQQVLTQAVTGKLTEEWRKGKELKGWRDKTVGSILLETPKNGAYYPKSLYGRGTRIIRIDTFYDGTLKYWEKVQKVEISEKDFESYKLEEGNIVINRVNSIDYLGKCMLVENLPEPAIFESNMMRLRLDQSKVLPKYLRTYLISQIGIKQLRQNAKHAVNQASINQSDVKEVIIKLPELKEQKKIVNRVENLFAKADAIEAHYEALKTKIEHLPQAILHKAFKGELVPQLESDGDARELLREIEGFRNKIKSSKK